jgi:hypothetical protein
MSAFVQRQNQRTATSLPAAPLDAAVVTRRIAKSMLGRAVTIRLNNGETIHGIVTNVLAAGRKPKVVVGGLQYPMAQVLTAAPPEAVSSNPAAVPLDPGVMDYLL